MAPLVFSIACLMMIAYQDFRHRAVYWFLFPLLLAALLWLTGRQVFTAGYGMQVIYNLAFLAAQAVLLTGYISLRQKRLVNLTHRHLGWGDILFILVTAFYFSPLNFFLFYIAGLTIALLSTLLWRIITRQQGTVPLAGIQALVLVAVLFIDVMALTFSALNDDWILNLLTNGR